MASAMSGRFMPQNPRKYMGDVNKIFFRSSWELYFLRYLDQNPTVLKYGSEEIAIPYVKPTDGKIHKYYPDFIIVYTDKFGKIQRDLIEIKPLKEALVEKAKTDYDKQLLAINMAKWAAAEEFCKCYGMRFRVLTEQQLFKNKPPSSAKKRNKA